jgi:outer membrane receptor for ferrienterochelin and colicins
MTPRLAHTGIVGQLVWRRALRNVFLGNAPHGPDARVRSTWGGLPRTYVIALLVLVALLCRTQRVSAGESYKMDDLLAMPLDELLEVPLSSVGSKYAQDPHDIPCSVTVVTADEIRRLGYRTLADILNSVPGFYVNYDRDYHHLGVRGFLRPGDYDTRILLLLDGSRLNENIYGSPFFGTQFPVDIDLIDRVEVLRGSGYSMYGGNALLAVVNVVTRGIPQMEGLEVDGGVGSDAARKGRITYGRAFSQGLGVMGSMTGYATNGHPLYFKEFDDPSTNNGWVDHDADQANNAFLKASWGDFTLVATRGAERKEIPTAPWGIMFGDKRTGSSDDTTLVGLNYDREVSNTLSASGHLSYHEYEYGGSYVYDYAEEGQDPRPVVNRDLGKGQWWEGEVHAVSTLLPRHTIVCGADFQYSPTIYQRNWDEEVYLDDRREGTNVGVFLQDEYKFTETLTLIAGLRHDEFSTFGGTTNPRLGLIWAPLKGTWLKLLYGQGFRAPTAYELYYGDGGTSSKPSLTLHPETVRTYEAIVEKDVGKSLHATVAGFQYQVNDVISLTQDPCDGLDVYRNTLRVESYGVEMGINGSWRNGLRASASYSFVQAENKTDHQALVNSPKHLAKLAAVLPVCPRHLFVGTELLYSSKASTPHGGFADDFVVVNATITYEDVVEGLDLSLGIYNLFNEDYGYPGSIEHTQDVLYQDGRTFLLRGRYRFR